MGLGAIGGANGGSAGARTQDQYLKRVLLYQLSYRPVRWRGGRDNTLAPARCTHRLLSAIAPRCGSATVPRGWLFREVTRFRRKASRSPDRWSATTAIVPTYPTRDLTRGPTDGAVENRVGGKWGRTGAPVRSTMVRTLNNNLQEGCYSRVWSVLFDNISFGISPVP